MSQAITRKILSDRNPFAGHNWWYEFVSLPRHFSENSVKKFSNRLTEQCAQQTKKWNGDLNSQWVCRDFLSLKMILSSSVMAQSLQYAEQNKDIGGFSFDDHEDGYRLHYIQRKHPVPTNLLHMMSEGHVEDFFGSWCNRDEPKEGDFNPDMNWGIIFDVP